MDMQHTRAVLTTMRASSRAKEVAALMQDMSCPGAQTAGALGSGQAGQVSSSEAQAAPAQEQGFLCHAHLHLAILEVRGPLSRQTRSHACGQRPRPPTSHPHAPSWHWHRCFMTL